MRKIISKEEERKRSRKNQLLIGGILIIIMVASTLGYAFGREQKSDTEEITYNGFEFTKTGNSWDTDTGDYQFSFLYNPEETEKVSSALNPLSSYLGKPLYIYSEKTEAGAEIYRNLFYQNQIAQRVQSACLEGEKCEDNSPIKTCESNFIIIKESNSTKIRQQDNCVFIEGNAGNLTKLSDSFLFKITGIQ